jgi:HAD superfamily hydrolase (TIGR01509 family)
MMESAILWDLDGTIADSFNGYYDAFACILDKYNSPRKVSVAEYRLKYFGTTFHSILNDVFGDSISDLSKNTISEEYFSLTNTYFRRKECIQPVSGVERILNYFLAAGNPMAIASSSKLLTVLTELQTLGMLHYFGNILSGEFLPSKPAPDVFLLAARSLNISPNRCVVFEDSLAGMQAAKAAGMKCVGIATTKKVEEMVDADIALTSFDNLDFRDFEKFSQN